MLTDRQRHFVLEHLRASHEVVLRASQLIDIDPNTSAVLCARARKRLATALRTLRSKSASDNTTFTEHGQ